jgi:hypothetical protein
MSLAFIRATACSPQEDHGVRAGAGANCLGLSPIRATVARKASRKCGTTLGGIGVVPANSVNEVSPRRGRKEYAGHSSEPAAQVGVDFFPSDRATGVLVEAGLLRLGQLHIRRGKAVPKLTDEVKPFLRGQAADVERCHVARTNEVDIP